MALTDREQEILRLIEQNPMISQHDLAQLCGITRSGVAAHISNLMKKGYIQGKGYIVSPPSYVSVIGGINMDIIGVADADDGRLVGSSSNTGHISMSLGGIARNISFDLARLEVPNYLISVYGSDSNGELFKADALANGLDIAYSKQLPHGSTSTFLSVRSAEGGQLVGLDDMSLSERIAPEFLEERRSVIMNSSCVAFDSSLAEDAIKWICDQCEQPLFARVVSVNKAARLLPFLGALDTVVLSSPEIPVLTGMEVSSEQDADRCAQYLLDRGVANVLLFLDNMGLLYCNASERCFIPWNRQDRHFSYRNGAASAALSALIWSRMENRSFDRSARYAYAAAEVTMQCVSSTNPQFSVEAVDKFAHCSAE